jgi:FtsP/CotA-like multicopper oxidase with cupredoxin domain
MRLLNANYHPQRWTWDTDVECRCSDGRPFDRGYELRSITLAPAERYDMIMRPRKPGVHRVRVETLHWITGKVLGYADTLITVTGDALPDLSPSPADPLEPGTGFPFDVPAVEAPIAPPPDLSQAAAAPAPAPGPAPAAPATPATPQTRVLGSKAKSKPKPKPKKKPLTLRERLKLKEKAAAKKRAEARRKAEAKLRAKAVAEAKAKAKAEARAKAKAKARANAKARLTGKVVRKPKRPSA